MKRASYYFLMIPFLLVVSGQTPCITCQSDTSSLEAVRNGVMQAVEPFRDSIFSKLAKINAKQDSIVTVIDSLCIKDKITVRREYINLYPFQTWRYDWYYRNGLFFKLNKKQL